MRSVTSAVMWRSTLLISTSTGCRTRCGEGGTLELAVASSGGRSIVAWMAEHASAKAMSIVEMRMHRRVQELCQTLQPGPIVHPHRTVVEGPRRPGPARPFAAY